MQQVADWQINKHYLYHCIAEFMQHVGDWQTNEHYLYHCIAEFMQHVADWQTNEHYLYHSIAEFRQHVADWQTNEHYLYHSIAEFMQHVACPCSWVADRNISSILHQQIFPCHAQAEYGICVCTWPGWMGAVLSSAPEQSLVLLAFHYMPSFI